MRRRAMLGVAVLFTCAMATGCRAAQTPPALEPDDGLISLTSGVDGATLVLSGTLTRNTFALRSLRVVGSRLAGRSSDPDQFRATLLGDQGREIGTVTMWSPLDTFEWDIKGTRESLRTAAARQVDIQVPMSIDVRTVVLAWPDGPPLARVGVGRAMRRFCADTPDNAACRSAPR